MVGRMHRGWGWLVLPLLLSASPPTARAEDREPAKRPKLVLVGLEASGAPAAEVSALAESLCTEVGSLDRFELLCGSELKVMLEHMSLQRLMGCAGDDCLRELSGHVKADWLLLGSVGKVGETFTLNLRLMNAQSGSVAGRTSRTVSKDLGRLLGELAPALKELLAAIPAGSATTGK
ncbi:MAG: hypothetical protein FJ125_10180 [Deltaproteobacteria bacterium]|nr:hypothetical protein [Deltaproteobacteria bacterium]